MIFLKNLALFLQFFIKKFVYVKKKQYFCGVK